MEIGDTFQQSTNCTEFQTSETIVDFSPLASQLKGAVNVNDESKIPLPLVDLTDDDSSRHGTNPESDDQVEASEREESLRDWIDEKALRIRALYKLSDGQHVCLATKRNDDSGQLYMYVGNPDNMKEVEVKPFKSGHIQTGQTTTYWSKLGILEVHSADFTSNTGFRIPQPPTFDGEKVEPVDHKDFHMKTKPEVKTKLHGAEESQHDWPQRDRMRIDPKLVELVSKLFARKNRTYDAAPKELRNYTGTGPVPVDKLTPKKEVVVNPDGITYIENGSVKANRTSHKESPLSKSDDNSDSRTAKLRELIELADRLQANASPKELRNYTGKSPVPVDKLTPNKKAVVSSDGITYMENGSVKANRTSHKESQLSKSDDNSNSRTAKLMREWIELAERLQSDASPKKLQNSPFPRKQ